MNVTTLDVLMRLLAAALLAAPVGLERGRKAHSAGLRTLILISMGSAAVILVALRVTAEEAARSGGRADPLRAIQGILAGMGLLAAGGIIRDGGDVKGLTTAAASWAMCAVGVACGHGQFDIAVIVTVLTLVATALLARVDPKDHKSAAEGPER